MKSDQFFVSNEMDVRPPPAKKRKQYAGVYQADWGRMFEGMIAPSKFGEHYAWCVPCSRDIKVSASGVYDVREHLKSKLHVRMVDSGRQQKPMTMFFKLARIDTPDSVITAEVMFSYFAAEHNLPAAIADHFTDLAPHFFPDSEVAKKFRCKRTKTTQNSEAMFGAGGSEARHRHTIITKEFTCHK